MDYLRGALPRVGIYRLMIAAIWNGAVCMAGGSAVAAAAEATPIEVYGHLPSLEDLALSPDGSTVVFVQSNGDERNLTVTALNEGKVLATASVGDTKLRATPWFL